MTSSNPADTSVTAGSTAAGSTAAAPTGPRVVDVHAHAMPMPLLRSLADRGLADVSAVDQGIVRLDPKVSGVGPGAPLPLARSQHDVATRLVEMDAAGVDVHAVSLPPFLFATNADDAGFATGIVAQGNDELAGYVAGAPDRLVGLGYVPLGWPGVADEAVRVLDELGLAGIAIGSQGGGKDLDDPVNEDLWALLAERNTFVFLHPSGMPAGPRLKDYWMPQLVGYPMETAIAVARLVFSGTLERYPITLCLAHGGGCVPSLRGRMDMGWERKDVAHTNDHPPTHYTDRLYYDTAVFNTTVLSRIVQDVGVEHVLMGTDHPFELGDPTPRKTVGDLGLSEADTAAILGGTASRLLGLA
ncbi:amidohydrolase family protein [Nakamurella multipartita]|uniref:amidohydrolase family protein n=1 Tax=Nakamurella multipartita TaxID=53461 RepID=UPI001C25D9F1|nr:amidohydrolase family protein [Nakamurella multipartita]HOZ60250.1 amidohydrolase family protein [Nakamurella multipartita]